MTAERPATAVVGGVWHSAKRALKSTPLDLVRMSLVQSVRRSRVDRYIMGFVEWPYRTYLYCPALRLIYAPIPKIASGNIKRWMLLEAGIPEERWVLEEFAGIHKFADRALCVRSWDRVVAPENRRAVFVRDPFARLVSGFLDKFVLPMRDPRWAETSPARPVLSWLVRRHGYRDRTDVTFEDFVGFVCAAPDAMLDYHWLPQAHFVRNVPFDFIGRTESFEQDFARLRELVGSRVPFEVRKPRLPYSCEEGGYAGTMPIRELLERSAFPNYRTFYRPETEARVARRYASDFAAFGYPLSLG